MRIGGTWMRLTLLVVGAIVVLGGIAYRAALHEPEFYRTELAVTIAEQEAASDAFVAQTTAVATATQQSGAWSLVLTQEQINGFLAVDLPRNHPQLLPPFLSEPRVQLRPREATLAARLRQGELSSVATLAIDLYTSEPNILAVRFRRLRTGAIPLPMEQLLAQLRSLAEQQRVPLRWTRHENDPVAHLDLTLLQTTGRPAPRIDQIEIRAGEIMVVGSSTLPQP